MHCADNISHSNTANLLANLKDVFQMKHGLHFHCKLKSYSFVFPAAQLCPSELINEICHHAKSLCRMTFPKTPKLPDAPLPTSSHINTHAKRHTHTPTLAYLNIRTLTLTGTSIEADRQAASQALIRIQRALQSCYFLLSPGSTNKHC